ncbi:hypothetical protein [Natrialba swarupiae]|uniref:Uncharacterized protein n=1 Tax=Natrialba swarupiae TaxID=2448032 RepID=A0A5D5AQ16_9EURY|nr:hypothetical protein [Natrialba swarupiae]MCW8172578.1 hypothetical protein [Natrialba swarupiae]TYT63124.1 hypothetical protein FYC77_05645 [Natrialba swarupiae]
MAPNPADDEIETGTKTDSDVPTTADVYAYADDGQHATVWAINRIDDQTVDVLTYRCGDGLIEQDGQVEEHHVEPDTTTQQFALEVAETDPEKALRLARAYHKRGY